MQVAGVLVTGWVCFDPGLSHSFPKLTTDLRCSSFNMRVITSTRGSHHPGARFHWPIRMELASAGPIENMCKYIRLVHYPYNVVFDYNVKATRQLTRSRPPVSRESTEQVGNGESRGIITANIATAKSKTSKRTVVSNVQGIFSETHIPPLV